VQGEAARRHLQLNGIDIFRRHRVKFKHRAIAGEVKRFEVFRVIDSSPAREFVEASEAYDFVAVARRNDFPPHGIDNVEVEFVRAAAYLAFLALRSVAHFELLVVGSDHVDK
jgi:hypothetical protein